MAKEPRPGKAFVRALSEPAPEACAGEGEGAPEGISGEEAVAAAMLKKAMRGDTSAAKFLIETAEKMLPEDERGRVFKLELTVGGDAH